MTRIIPPARFETARLVARRPSVTDAPAVLAAYAGDPEVTRYLSWKAYDRIEPVAEFLLGRMEAWEKGDGAFAWMLCLRGSDEPIGSIGCTIDAGRAMFGYVLGRRHWGRGLMAEALGWLVDWSLSQPEIFRAWAFCDVENPASARVMEKAGMRREGVLCRWHTCPTIGPGLRDCLVYAKVR